MIANTQFLIAALTLLNLCSALTPKQSALIGHWTIETQEGLDDYYKAVGVGWFFRTGAKMQRPTAEVRQENPNLWHVAVKTAYKDIDWKLPLNRQGTTKTMDGRIFHIKTTLDQNGHLRSVEIPHPREPQNIPSVVDRYVNDAGKLVVTETAPTGQVMTRIFTRVR